MNKSLTIMLPLAFLVLSCGNMKKEADLIITHAKVYTVNESFATASAFAVGDGKILDVGETREITQRYKAPTTLDLEGKPVYPGFIDAHCHFYGYSMNLRQVDLVGTTSYGEIIDKLKEYERSHDAQWIVGRGWDQNDWKVKEFPTKERLDEAFPDKPVYLRRIDGHAALVNSVALKKAGIDGQTTVEGGHVMVEQGEPTGILVDNAAGLVSKLIPEPTRQEKIDALQTGAENCFEVGLTTVADAGLNHDEISLMDSLQQSGQLKMQTYAMLSPTEKNFR